MAQRYGGKYSPGQTAPQAEGQRPPPVHPFDGKLPARAGMRSNLLFLGALSFLPAAFMSDPKGLIFGLAAAGATLLGAWLTREGLKAENAYNARTIARRPALPRKVFGAICVGAGLALGGLMHGAGLVFPAILGVIGAGLHLGAFGLDPMKDKGAEGIDSFQTDRVARAIDEAETMLSAMSDAILRARDRSMETRVAQFAAAARALFRTVEQDPRDLTAARKYLSVYLLGARDATVKFADLYAQTRDPKAREDYIKLLDDLETTFAARSTALLNDNRTDLDVEISVLRDRLKAEA